MGDPSSKYGYDHDGSKFDADIRAHAERVEFLWNEFVKFMKSHNASPQEFRNMFHRYYKEYLMS